MKNEELLQIIEQAAREKATVLHLFSNQLSSLPPEICQLSNLTELDLHNNQLSSLPPEICQLSNLNELDLSNNQLNSLPLEICQLSNLTTLYLYYNQLSSLSPEIGQLSNLTELYLSDNQLSSLPPEIGQLSNLTELSLGGNPELALPPPEIVEQGIQAIYTYLRESSEEPEIQAIFTYSPENLESKSCNLRIYKIAFEAAMKIFELSKNFPVEEQYSLTDQIRRASRSVCANIAKAWQKRRYEAAFVAKLNDCEAEVSATQTWIEFAVKCNYMDVQRGRELHGSYNKILSGLLSMMNHPSRWLIKH